MHLETESCRVEFGLLVSILHKLTSIHGSTKEGRPLVSAVTLIPWLWTELLPKRVATLLPRTCSAMRTLLPFAETFVDIQKRTGIHSIGLPCLIALAFHNFGVELGQDSNRFRANIWTCNTTADALPTGPEGHL